MTLRAQPFATEGQRLRALVDAAWKGGGGVRGLARASGVTPEALYAWFRGENLPSLTSIRSLAEHLGMRPVDVVAVIDGVTAPEQQETPRPAWVEGFMDDLFRRWDEAEPPGWASRLTERLERAVEAAVAHEREELAMQTIEAALQAVRAGHLRMPAPSPGDAGTPASEDRRRSRRAAPASRRS